MVTAGLPIKIVGYLKVLIPVFLLFCEVRLITTPTVNHSVSIPLGDLVRDG